jgi:hypothetical protein
MTSKLSSTDRPALLGPQPDWPSLPFSDWEATCDTLHLWTQIVGKTRLALSPPQNHWWHVPLYVTPRGLSTSPIPFGSRTFDVEFDFIAHQVGIRTSAGEGRNIPLFPRSVADFHAEYMACLNSLGIDVTINPAPQEFDDATPFNEDRHHASYDQEYVERFRRILIGSDRVLKEFRSGFVGKCSPVHFFWGSFDLAVTRFSGQRAPQPEKTNSIMAEAYSHEVISCGFWPGGRGFKHPAFYAYALPAPSGIDKAAHWDTQLGEFILKYEAIREVEAPERAILDFCQGTYEAGAKLAQWDRQALERNK